MKVISDLGEAVESRWRELGYAESKFPRIAEEALRRFEPARSVGTESVVRWLIEEFQVPEQHLEPLFGQPPVPRDAIKQRRHHGHEKKGQEEEAIRPF